MEINGGFPVQIIIFARQNGWNQKGPNHPHFLQYRDNFEFLILATYTRIRLYLTAHPLEMPTIFV